MLSSTVPAWLLPKLTTAIETVQELLQGWAQGDLAQAIIGEQSSFYSAVLVPAFGSQIDPSVAQRLQQQFAAGDFAQLPQIEVRPSAELLGAYAAYAAQTERMYVAEAFLAQASAQQVVAVLLEEVGHSLDGRLNAVDSSGDEGAIFSALVRGLRVDETALAGLRVERDDATLLIDGQAVAVEQARLVVSNTNDSGVGSLRQAILDANSTPEADTIDFDLALSGETITLSSGQLTITSDLTIDGDLNDDGVADITVDANQASRVFNINDGDNAVEKAVSITGIAVTGGAVASYGGGILNRENLSFSNATISGNSTSGNLSEGGGIVNIGTATFSNATISGNSTTGNGGNGGGIVNIGTATFSNATISGNSTTGNRSAGGGIANFGTATFSNATISGNTTSGDDSDGGGIYNNGTATLNSTIVANNTAPSGDDDLSRRFGTINATNSLIENDADQINGTNTNNITGQDPLLDPSGLQNNGGSTQTIALQPNSPAINAGSNALIPTDTTDQDNDGNTTESVPFDQRGSGFERVIGAAVDIGAVESQNTAPIINSPNTATVEENQTDAITITATDDQPGITYSLSGGADAALFDINVTTGEVTFITAPDFEAPTDNGVDNTYNIQVTATDAVGLADIQDITVTVTDVFENTAPVITSSPTATADENQTNAITITATDDQPGVTYSLSGGADAALFNIDATSGQVTFKTAPDFEAPTDDGNNNVYELQVTATDAGGLADIQDIAVTVTDVFENTAPVITSANTATADENQTNAVTVVATDDQPGVTYSLSGGADETLFNIDATSGQVTFKTAPDFENPTDNGADNTYDIQVTATDVGGLADVQNIAITVTDVFENGTPIITSAPTTTVDENQTDAITVVATDDQPGVTYSLSGGVDAALFNIDTTSGQVTFINAPDFENPTDDGNNNVYDLQVTATDAGGLADIQDITVTVTDVFENGVPVITSSPTVTVGENQTDAITITATDDQAGVQYSVTGGVDANLLNIDASTGEVTFITAPDFENPTDTNGNNIYELQVTATDINNSSTTQPLAITVADAPESLTLTLPATLSENDTPVTGTLTRDGTTTTPLTVTLSSSDPSEVTVPSEVTFAAGATSTPITLTPQDDNIADGSQTVTITANSPAGSGFGNTTTPIAITDNEIASLSLTIDPDSISETGGTATATVTRNDDLSTDLLVALFSDDTGEATVPQNVTIPAGQPSAPFDITALDDAFADGPQTATITATAAGLATATTPLTVTDTDIATLTLSLQNTRLAERSGSRTEATLTRNTENTDALTVFLSSSDTTEATVPGSVTFAAGDTTTSFSVRAVSDALVDGPQTATITAAANGFVSGSASVDVIDNDEPMLQLTLADDSISETGSTTAGITRNTEFGPALTVFLSSSDPTEATVPTQVTFNAGELLTTFSITGIDDGLLDGTQTTTITATAPGFPQSTASLSVTDASTTETTIFVDASNTIRGNAFFAGEQYQGLLFSNTDTGPVSPDDVIVGTAGDDNIWAGAQGNDRIDSKAGNDTIGIGQGNAQVSAGDGDDFVYGISGGGTNTIDVGEGNNNVWMQAGSNNITAGSGNDVIGLGTGRDVVRISGGNNVIYRAATGASDGNKDIVTGAGDDYMELGSGDDLIDGGGGLNTLFGDGGADTFTLRRAAYNFLGDFAVGIDQIKLIDISVDQLSFVAGTGDFAGSTFIFAGGEGLATVVDTSVSELQSGGVFV